MGPQLVGKSDTAGMTCAKLGKQAKGSSAMGDAVTVGCMACSMT